MVHTKMCLLKFLSQIAILNLQIGDFLFILPNSLLDAIDLIDVEAELISIELV
jgi:hypothetical protein